MSYQPRPQFQNSGFSNNGGYQGYGGRNERQNGHSYGGGYQSQRQNHNGSFNGYNQNGGDRYNNNYSSNGSAPLKNVNVIKNFYQEDPMIAAANPEQVAEFRKVNNNIMVFPSNESQKCPAPVINFDQAFKCDPEILKAIQSQNFVQPSAIQCQLWPIILSGYDAIAISQTGSGKTIGFLLPGLVHAHNQTDPQLTSDTRSPSILVICPTRELAIQTNQECEKYKYREFRSACIYGGAPKGAQINQLRAGVKIVVGTPGRINDLSESQKLYLDKVTYVVLDEADRMLDMGFEPQIRQILDRLPKNRQTVMTSATWPDEAKNLAYQYLTDPIQINIGNIELTAAASIKQTIELDYTTQHAKQEHMLFNLRSESMRDRKVLVFCNTKDGAKQLNYMLKQSGLRSTTIHGNLDQREREIALGQLKSGHCNLLTATDVAARGLDISDIEFVINFDMANNIDEYVHRIGRTGRAGREGRAITYFTPENAGLASKLIEVLKKTDQVIHPKLYQYQSMPGKSSMRNRGFRNPNSGGFDRGNSGSRFGGSNFRNSSNSFGGGFKREKNDGW